MSQEMYEWCNKVLVTFTHSHTSGVDFITDSQNSNVRISSTQNAFIFFVRNGHGNGDGFFW